jgi:hypothetical protein
VLTKCNDGSRVVEENQNQFANRQAQLKVQEAPTLKLRQNPALSDPKSGKKEELQVLVQKPVADRQQLHKDTEEA